MLPPQSGAKCQFSFRMKAFSFGKIDQVFHPYPWKCSFGKTWKSNFNGNELPGAAGKSGGQWIVELFAHFAFLSLPFPAILHFVCLFVLEKLFSVGVFYQTLLGLIVHMCWKAFSLDVSP